VAGSVTKAPAAVSINTYRPSPKGAALHADPAKFRLLMGAWGSGKSTWGIWETILTALENPGSRLVIFRKTYPALRDTTWRDFLNECPDELIVDGSQRKSEGREEVTLQGGSVVQARCLDDWKKLGSSSFDFIFNDEAYEFDEKEFDMLAMGRLRGQVGPRRMILATNPPNRKHWLYTRFQLSNDPDYAVMHFATFDNYVLCDWDHPKDCQRVQSSVLPNGDPVPEGFVCHLNLPEGYIDNLRKLPENEQKRFLYGEWGHVTEGTPIFGEFSESRHTGNLKPEPGVQIYRGWDFGFRHPACVWLQALPTGHVQVLAELLGNNVDIETFARQVQAMTAQRFPNYPVVDYCDIAGIQKNDLGLSSIAILQKFGVHPRRRKLRIWKTIDGMRDMLSRSSAGFPLLRVHCECHWLIEGFSGGYVVDVRPSGDEVPQTRGDAGIYTHAMDALRYAMADIFLPSHAGRAREFAPTRLAARYAV
jgi:PBSX family phage terminase large subunit